MIADRPSVKSVTGKNSTGAGSKTSDCSSARSTNMTNSELNQEDLDDFIANPDLYERTFCENSLLDFITFAWPALEPEVDFVTGWVIERMAAHLEAVSEGKIKRLLINVPPGFCKSMLVNVFWPAWEWGPRTNAHYRFISASYEKTLATRDLVRCRDLLQDDWYQKHWPLKFKGDENQKTRYENASTGWRQSASVGSALTGHRGDRIIIDDPHSVKTAESELEREESLRWMSETVPTRLNKQGESAIVVIMQRLHARDVSGLIIDELGEDYVHLHIPMEFESQNCCWSPVPSPYSEAEWCRRIKDEGDPVPRYEYVTPDHPEAKLMYKQDPRTEEGELAWPERFPHHSVESLKRAFRAVGGSYAEAAQLQQRPVPRGGGMFSRDSWQIVPERPNVPGYSTRGWDLAASTGKSAAWTVGLKLTLLDDGRLVIEDVRRLRGTGLAVEQAIFECAQLDGYDTRISIPQDPGQAGKAQVAGFARLLHGYDVSFSPESGDKETRAIPIAAQVEGGNVLVVKAPWNDTLFAEAGLFPNSQFKDQVDALSRAYHDLLKGRDEISLFGPRLILPDFDNNVDGY